MTSPTLRRQELGMTMIEMIGVLGVIAVLAALILPKVFEVIAESKVEALVVAVHTYETAVTGYYQDMGTILPLNADGLPQREFTGNSSTERSLAARLTLSSADALVLSDNLWPKFQGPYLERFDSKRPPELGTKMFLPARGAVEFDTQVTGINLGWDLKGDDGNSDLPSNADVVYFRLNGLSEEEFLELDQIIDPGVGTTNLERKIRGRAKWDPEKKGNLMLYLAHR